jgi:tetratricopeptide (TPR) repeat protein
MKYIKFAAFTLSLTLMLFSCRQKLDEKDIPDVDQVMLNSAGPRLDKLNEDIERDPENPLNFYKRSKIWYELLDYNKALADINEAIRLDNRQGKFYYLLGRIYQNLDQKTLALKAAERSAELGNKEAGVLTLLAELYDETGNTEKADLYLVQAANVAPHHPEVIYLQANQQLRKGDTTAALTGFRKAISADPKFSRSYVGAAEIYENRKKNDSAMIFIIQGLRYSREKAPLYYLNGKVLERIGMKESGFLSYETAATMDSSFYPVFLKLGDYHYEKGDSVKSISYYSHYVKNDFSKKEVNFRLARLYVNTSQGEKAIPLYEHIVASDTSNIQAKEALKSLYAKYGEKAKPAVKPDTAGISKHTPPPATPATPAPGTKQAEKDTVRKPAVKKPAPASKPKTPKKDSVTPATPKTEEPAPAPAPAPQENQSSNKVELDNQPIIETAPPADNQSGQADSKEEKRKKKKNKQKE